MRAVARFGGWLLAGALTFAPAMALAQQTTTPPPATANQSQSSVIVPPDAGNFSLSGTVTRPADGTVPVAAPPAGSRTRAPRTTDNAPPASSGSPDNAAAAPAATERAPSRPPETSPARSAAPAPAAAEPLRQSPPAATVTVNLPQLDGSSGAGSGAAAPASTPPTSFPPAPDTGSGSKFPLLPWLIALLAVVGGGAFLFLRNRNRMALAGGPEVHAFVAPEPEPRRAPAARPVPAPPPRAAAPAPPPPLPGLVSTRLRPWIDIAFKPTRCVLDDALVTIEFELELLNSGSAPARAVLAEATVFNAGPNQEEEVSAFFANPVGAGERIVAIPPLQRVAIRTQVTAPRDKIIAYEIAGRQVFVPIVGFNAIYSWASGEGQTSVSYLVGRDTNGEKLGPFRLDLGPRIFRGIAAHLLPTGIRR